MKILAFGEILFDVDVKKNEKKLGGAPMNFCSHLSKLGAKISIGSRDMKYTENTILLVKKARRYRDIRVNGIR